MTILNKDEDPETKEATGVGQIETRETASHASPDPREMIGRADSVKLSDDHNNN